MSRSRAGRTGAGWRVAWVSLAAAIALLTAGCASDIAGEAVTTSTGTTSTGTTNTGTTNTGTTNTGTTNTVSTAVTPGSSAADWNPRHLHTIAADIHQTTATIHVGERLQFTARDSDTVYFSVEPEDLSALTFYGNDLTFVGTKPGHTTLRIPNYDKHFDCPNGPCAHPNSPLSMTVTVLAGSVAAPSVPAPITLDAVGTSRTVHVEVGQQLRIGAAIQVSTYSSEAAGFYLGGELGNVDQPPGSANPGSELLVGAKPGTAMLGLADTTTSTEVRLMVVIDA